MLSRLARRLAIWLLIQQKPILFLEQKLDNRVVFAFGDGVERVVEVAEHGLKGKSVIQQEVFLTGDLFVWKLDAELHKVRGFSCVLVRGQNVVLDTYRPIQVAYNLVD